MAARHQMLPYLAIIRRKLPDIADQAQRLRRTPTAGELCFGILQEKLDQPLPARADLVVLARRRHAGPDA